MPTLQIHIDGGSRGNPGPAGAGVVIHHKENDLTLYEGARFLGRMTNNVAEYSALLHALTLAQRSGATTLEIRSDSELMVRQINGEYKVKSDNLKPLYKRCVEALDNFDKWTMQHVRREKNKRADELANLAMDGGRNITVINCIDTAAHGQGGDANIAWFNAANDDAQQQDAPSWSACLAENAECPLGTPPKQRFTFGPHTPAGFCIHAAAAAFAARDDDPDTPHAVCPKCSVNIEIDSVADDQ